MNNGKIRLGVVGLSAGNGHPYSWSAICNGFDKAAMAKCPFPVIPEYLAAEKPAAFIQNAVVTHIWTQDKEISAKVARASKIENIADSIGDMAGKVDGLLLARDDAQNHYEMVREFINAGGNCPIYVDKPLAFNLADAQKIYALEKYEGQIFSCSAMRYAREIEENIDKIKSLGNLSLINAVTMKRWDTYSAHIVDPVLRIIDEVAKTSTNIKTSQAFANANSKGTMLVMETGLIVNLAANKHSQNPVEITMYGDKGNLRLALTDTFYAFRGALQAFIRSIQAGKSEIPQSHVLKLVEIIERGER